MDTIIDTRSPQTIHAGSQPPPRAPDVRTVLRAPGITQFRANPFRVLRLPAAVPPAKAVWQAEKALARVRAGVALPDHDLVPWLPPPDEVEIQEAAQKLEEPLRRLREQLLWFDLAGDPYGQHLAHALSAADSGAIHQYLGIAHAVPLEQQPAAHRLNQANLRLLLAVSWLSDVGPELPGGGGTSPAADPRLTLATGESGGERVNAVDDPHALFDSVALPSRARAWPGVLADALRRWSSLLQEPVMQAYVDQQIAQLGDELVTDADIEPLLAAVKTALTDLVVGELKLRMMVGQGQGASDLFQVIAESGFDEATWQLALRPLKALLVAELEDLEPLVDERQPANLDDLGHYFRRVNGLRNAWRKLDPQKLLGPDDLADEAIAKGFARLRAVEHPAMRIEQMKKVVGEAAQLAASASLKERITAFGKRVVEYKDDLCHWCGKREAKRETCAAVSGRVETGRVRHYNSTTVHYRVQSTPIPRCPRCAERHQRLKATRGAAWLGGSLLAVTTLILLGPDIVRSGAFAMGAIMLAVGVLIFTVLFTGHKARRAIIPAGERPYDQIHDSAAMQRLRSEGYSGIQFDSRTDAWVRISERNESPKTGDGGGIAALKVFGFIILIVVLAALRTGCRHW